jgi:hypothetical protein
MCTSSISAENAINGLEKGALPLGSLSPLEKIALVTAIKDAEIKPLKEGLKEGFTGDVDFRIRIKGRLQKGFDAAATSTPFGSDGALCTILKLLGIGPTKLRNALQNLPAEFTEDPKLAAVLAEARKAHAEAHPKNKRGSVTSQLSVERL